MAHAHPRTAGHLARLVAGATLMHASWGWAQAGEPAAATEPPAPPALPAEPAAPTQSEIAELKARLDRQEAEAARQAAELAALRAEAESRVLLEAQLAEEEARKEEKLRFYGFMDAGLQKAWFPRSSGLNTVVESTSSTFVLGNLNLYIDAKPTEGWRALAEVRFTTYPHGNFTAPPPGGQYQRTSTLMFDVNSASGGFAQVRWGAIVLERAQIEWSKADWLRLRAGYWLTPYGIWNVDHGTPTLISLNVPQFVVHEVFPSRQLGVEASGTLHTGAWDVEYHAYVSNGRTPGQLDPTEDKMVGGRLVLGRSSPTALRLGASAFYGRYSDTQARTLRYEPLEFARDEVIAFDEAGFGADLAIGDKQWRFRSEFAINRRAYDEGKQEPGWFPGSYFPNRVFWGTYALLAYDTQFAGLEPYVYGELDRNMLPTSQAIVTPSVGLNIHFTPAAQLKLQYSYSKQFDFDDLDRDLSEERLHFVASRLVVAF
jgi:hypothetical protein